MATSTKPLLLVLEGNIGVGKSTFLQSLHSLAPELSIVLEPTDQWQEVTAAGNLLDLFYKDTARWAYTFQSYAFLTRIKALRKHLKTTTEKKCILERSIYADRYCFAKNAYEMGMMNSLEWHLYTEWFNLLETSLPLPYGFIYLQATPKTCYDRIIKRNRSEEKSISLSYLTMLHTKHETWLIEKKGIAASLKALPVLVLDCNIDFEADEMHMKEFVKKIQTFSESFLPTQEISSVHRDELTH